LLEARGLPSADGCRQPSTVAPAASCGPRPRILSRPRSALHRWPIRSRWPPTGACTTSSSLRSQRPRSAWKSRWFSRARARHRGRWQGGLCMRAHPWDPVLTPGIRSAVIRQDLLRLAHALRRWLANRQV